MIETLIEKTTAVWSQWILTGLLESAVMLLLVLLIWGVIRKRCSQGVGYLLFLLVMLKLLVPVGIPLPEVLVAWRGVGDEGRGVREEEMEHSVELSPLPEVPRSQPPVFEPLAFEPPVFESLIDDIEDVNGQSSVVGSRSLSGYFGESRLELPVRSTARDRSEIGHPPAGHGVSTLPEHSLLASDPSSLTPGSSSLATNHWPLITRHWPLATMLTWLAIVTFLLTRFAVSQRRFAKVLRERRLIDASRFYPHDAYSRGQRHNATAQVPVFACPNIAVPAVYGFFRPIILFPEAMLQQLTVEQLRWVLLHELAHIRRRDLQTAFVQRLAVILHFYNPAVWVASWWMNHLRESACDDMALAADTTIPRKTIGDALLCIVEHSAVADRPGYGTPGALNFAGSVRHRLVRLLDQKRILYTKTGAGSMTLLILITVLLVPHWQALPTPINPQMAEDVVARNDANPVNVPQETDKMDGQKKNDNLRENLENRLRAGRDEVAATVEAHRVVRRTDSAQVLDAQIRHLQTLYRLQVSLEEENYQRVEELRKRGMVTEAQLLDAERPLLKAKITLSSFIIDCPNWVIEPDTVTRERENLLGCYQRLFELAKLDYERVEQLAAKGTATQEELRAYRQKMVDAEIVVAQYQLREEQRKSAPAATGLDARIQAPKSQEAIRPGQFTEQKKSHT
ncbi:MAG: M48 family metalloprotease, partial [Planctomycetaceae bacterium]|nr:M48 family metalloprotease [Planctomycetaceae bacterium]